MEKLKFKTNINCSGCIATFTPFIQGKAGINAWNVDTTTPDKVLTVEGELSQEEVVALVKVAGFQVKEVMTT
jgi:copper chaperone